MSELDDVSETTKALGLLVVRAAMLETTLVELIVRIRTDAGGDAGQVRAKFTGKSGQSVVEELRRLGRAEVADAYAAIAEQRNHLVHGNGLELRDVGYHVKHSPPAKKGDAPQLRERVWKVREIVDLSVIAIAFEEALQGEVRAGGNLPDAYMVTGPIRGPWVPPQIKLP
ncbi:hypothetical protein V6N00_09110 [Tersicoccus sp. MR15.9]|uniref:hypothetical protein n=1 Tax=Tersicoccus mangrovi TaxID=3121635 RepID=UPI002FE54F41